MNEMSIQVLQILLHIQMCNNLSMASNKIFLSLFIYCIPFLQNSLNTVISPLFHLIKCLTGFSE